MDETGSHFVAPDDARQRRRIRETILRHIRKDPDAADTVRGILDHWLPASGFESAPDHIAAVLEELVAEGLLQPHDLPGSGILYAAGERRSR